MAARTTYVIILSCFFAGTTLAAELESSGSRKVLFFDLWKLDYWDNVALTQGEPEFLSEATYNDPTDSTGGIYFPSVWKDEEAGEWRLVYSCKWSPFTLMAAHSDDGIHWRPLPVEGQHPEGGKLAPHHIFTLPDGEGGAVYRDPQQTNGFPFRIFGRQRGKPVVKRALRDPTHRWHDIVCAEGDKRYVNEGVTLVSADGLNWQLKQGGHWNWMQDDWAPEPPVFAFWNRTLEQHTMLVRPGWGDRRQCIRTTDDLESWSDPQLLFQPDTLDSQSPIGFYGMPTHAVGNGAGYVGLLWVFRNSSSEPVESFNQFYGVMDNELAYSYDGICFERTTREPFLKLNPMPEYGCAQIRTCSIVEREEDILIYSEGHRAEHGRERSEQRLHAQPLCGMIIHRLRKDGWMYLRSRGDWARLQTKPFTLFDAEICLNVSAPFGEVRFQLTNEKSEPIAGFGFDDCNSLQGVDTLSGRLAWKGEPDRDQLIGQVLRLEIKLRSAKLYAIDMAHHFVDAQDKWLLQDGKNVPAQLFDY